jgi:subtilisin family serine protease
LLATFVTCATVPASASSDSVSTFYMDRAVRVPVTVYYNQVGVLIPGGLRGTRLQSLASQFGLQQFYSNEGGIYTWLLSQAADGDSIFRLAERIKRDAGTVVAVAGLVVSHAGRFSPMLVTKEFVVHFHPWVSRQTIDSLNTEHGVEIVRQRPKRPNRYLLRASPRTVSDGLALGNAYSNPRFTRVAHANFVYGVISAYTPKDEYFADQWHHDNRGTSGGLTDADIDTPQAWDLTKGSSDVVIAVIDGGFDPDSPDLKANLWNNPEESESGARANHDDDGNGYVDDFHGWDFYDCLFSACAEPECGQLDFCQPPIWEQYHGTAVAGLAAAPVDNDCGPTFCEGVVGVCPECKIMAIERTYDSERLAECFNYAEDNGADVINCSWYLTSGTYDPNLQDAIHEAACAPPDYDGPDCVTPSKVGIPIFFATGNEELDGCGTRPYDIIQDASVISVGGTTNKDERTTDTTYGECMDVMAPTHGGTLHIATADHHGSDGYNTLYADPSIGALEPCPTGDYSSDLDYTKCFCGTSASTPMVAGLAGLLLSAKSSLSREQIQRLIQDTADKIESDVAAYGNDTGFSAAASLPNGRGYGRVNAFEAVRVAAPRPTGRAGVDIMLRDNTLDWGNTEQPSSTRFADDTETPALDRGFIGYWSSQDIKVVPGGCPATAPNFDDITDGDIAADGDNCVYIRVRNRGFVEAAAAPSEKVVVKAYWAHVGTAVPNLPSDFWSGFATNTFTQTDWHLIGEQRIESVPYSGSTAAREARTPGSGVTDEAKVVMIPFHGPALDPALRNHYCMLAMVDSPDDHVAAYQVFLDTGTNTAAHFEPDDLTPADNNVSHRNYVLFDSTDEDTFAMSFYVRNTAKEPIQTAVYVKHPQKWKVNLGTLKSGEPFTMNPGEQRLVTLATKAPRSGERGELEITQAKQDRSGRPIQTLGGLNIRVAPRDRGGSR